MGYNSIICVGNTVSGRWDSERNFDSGESEYSNIRLTSHPLLSVCRVKSNVWESNIRRFDQLVMNIRLKNGVRRTRITIFGYSSSRILALGGRIFEIPFTALGVNLSAGPNTIL